MLDNLLKAVVDAIAESDNEIGGLRLTRLYQAHFYGGDDGYLETANPTKLKSKTAIFVSSDVNRLVDFVSGTQKGTYKITAFTDSYEVTLQTIDSATPSFTDESDLRWRFSDLIVESTWQFPTRDRRLELYVGTEPDPLSYCRVIQLLANNRFEGLGSQISGVLGEIDTTAPQNFDCGEAGTFDSSHIGAALWILPADGGSNGNEGPRRITAIVDDHTVTFAGPAFIADETNVFWRVKTYEESGYLTENQWELVEVVDNSLTASAVGQLRRSQKVDLAEAEELDRIARRNGLSRPRGLSDELWRRVIKAICYGPKSTIQAFENLLTALYPLKNFDIYEDLANYPAELFLDLPFMDPGIISEGRTFLTGLEAQTSLTAATITVNETPISIFSVKVAPIEAFADTTVLPSADSPAWLYQPNADTEGNVFSIVNNNVLQHTQNGTSDGGFYRYDFTSFSKMTRNWEFNAFFRIQSAASFPGEPFAINVRDGEYQAVLYWSDTEMYIGSNDISRTEYTARKPINIPNGTTNWTQVQFKRVNDRLIGKIGGQTVEVNVSDVQTSTITLVEFGYVNDDTLNYNFVAQWSYIQFVNWPFRNFWNTYATGSVLSNPDNLTNISDPFLAGDVGKEIIIYSEKNQNNGRWRVKTFNAINDIDIEGIQYPDTTVIGKNSDINSARIILQDAFFTLKDIGKTIKVSGSSQGNDGNYTVLDFVDTKTLIVDNATGFSAETDVIVEFVPNFEAETQVVAELIGTGSAVGKNLTLRSNLPQANQDVIVEYTKVLSAQLMRNESIKNLGSGASAPNIFYPFYLIDVDLPTKILCEEIKAAGIKINYSR